MIKTVKKGLVGVFVLILIIINISLLASCLLSFAGVRFLIPQAKWRRGCLSIMNKTYHIWVDLNYLIMQLLPTRWHVSGHENLSSEQSYLVIANHRSWLDILVIQCILNRRTSHNIFVLKDILRWLPFAGWVCWAMGYLFVKRVTPAQVRKNPSLKYADRDSINQGCERLKKNPFTLINFVEGTRFSEEKRQKQKSVYENLLSPNVAGFALIFNALSENVTSVLDVTLIYDDNKIDFWQFLQGNLSDIKIQITTIDPKQLLRGDFMRDRVYRKEFRQMLNKIWLDKDARLSSYYACQQGQKKPSEAV